MTSKIILLSALFALTLSSARATETMDKKFMAGSGEVKSWLKHDYELIKGGFSPLVIYIYDHAAKKNALAFHFEGATEGVANATLKEKLAKFTKVKIKSDGSDSKGWPDALLKGADKGASLILMSSDLTIQIVFDKSKEKADINLQSIMTAVAGIQAHEDKLKKLAELEDRKAHPVVVEKEKEKEPEMFVIGLDKDKKKPGDPKKPGDKAADAKAPGAADAKGTGDKTADAKKDGKKMALDE